MGRRIACLASIRVGVIAFVADAHNSWHPPYAPFSASVQYSFSLTTFSPSGKLVQIEYALAAVNAGATSLGIKASNGVVIATEKKLPSTLVDEKTVKKISLLTPNIGVVYSGMGPDSRVLVRKARKAGQTYYRQYHENMPVAQLVREIAAVMQEFTRACAWVWEIAGVWVYICLGNTLRSRCGHHIETALCPLPHAESGGVRPFGVSLLMAGVDENGPQLYQIDPSGSYFAWKASAIGKNAINARTFLEKRYSEDIELEDAIHTALLTIKDGFEGGHGRASGGADGGASAQGTDMVVTAPFQPKPVADVASVQCNPQER